MMVMMIIIILFPQAVEGKDSGHTSGFKEIKAGFRDRFKGRKNEEIQGKSLSAHSF